MHGGLGTWCCKVAKYDLTIAIGGHNALGGAND